MDGGREGVFLNPLELDAGQRSIDGGFKEDLIP